jgi:uncharacterized repeat protein (TIGR03803 family)
MNVREAAARVLKNDEEFETVAITSKTAERRGANMHKANWGMKACGAFLLCATAAVAFSAQKFTLLHSFDDTDGANSYAALVQGTDGNLYGTTESGGVKSGGTVFKITTSGTLTTLYSFCSQSGCTDGANPKDALIQATDGGFYGTTYAGGANGFGTVFKITSTGTLTTLYSFCPQSGCTDGASPQGGLVQASPGIFIGTTQAGGVSGDGTVFKITASGGFTTLHSFDKTDGESPAATLIQATNGNYYGTTQSGGTSGDGTVFEITPSGTLTSLHSFDFTDGYDPTAGLVQGTDGDFYGVTENGGTHGAGTVYKITSSGTLTTLYSFLGTTDGFEPTGTLVLAADGNFYGTSLVGGSNSAGTIFEITPAGAFTLLHTFVTTAGDQPYGGLLQNTNGAFYGTTFNGGANDFGTVYSLSTGLGEFVETQPSTGKIGAAVDILGTDLTGATSVTFNATPAAFTVTSHSLITTTVPSGATSGIVRVVTPNGTLKSTVSFHVLQ